MMKKASELKRGDITLMGAVAHTLYHIDGLAILCEGGHWIDCTSGDELVHIKNIVKACNLRTGMSAIFPSRESPTHIEQIAGSDDAAGFLIAGYRDGRVADWIRVRGDKEFEVVE
jgi:hypothetical protein